MPLLIATSLVLAGCAQSDEGASSARPRVVAGPCDDQIAELRDTIREQDATVEVFVTEDAAADVRALGQHMSSIEGVEEIETRTKEQALERAKALFEDSPDVMENLPGNPFPASITLTVDPERGESVARAAERLDGVDYAESGASRGAKILRTLVGEYEGGDKAQVCRRLDALSQFGPEASGGAGERE